ncbi:MAG TPA: cache domain-containing protein [Herbaspirillum sp.]
MKKSTVWPQLRLSWWIAIGIAATVVITTLLLLLVVDQFARHYAHREAEVRLKQLAWQMRESLDQSMKERIVDIQDLSRSGPVRNFFENPVGLRTILTQTQNEFSDYAWIGVADASGRVVAGTQSMLEGRNAARRPWFIGGQKDLYVGEYRPSGPPPVKLTLPFAVQPGFVDISLPVFDQKGLFKGVLGAHLSWAWARQIARDLLDPANQRYNMEILVVRDDGLVLLGPKKLENTRIDSASLKQARAGQTGALTESWSNGNGQDTRYITAYVRTGMWTGQAGLNWSILVRQPEHVALADILVLEKQMVVVAALECLLLLVCGILVAYRVVAPMTALTTAIETRRTAADDYEPVGWSYYEFNRLSKAVGNLSRHTFAQPATDLEPRVNARVAALREMVADLPPADPHRNRALFK